MIEPNLLTSGYLIVGLSESSNPKVQSWNRGSGSRAQISTRTPPWKLLWLDYCLRIHSQTERAIRSSSSDLHDCFASDQRHCDLAPHSPHLCRVLLSGVFSAIPLVHSEEQDYIGDTRSPWLWWDIHSDLWKYCASINLRHGLRDSQDRQDSVVKSDGTSMLGLLHRDNRS